MLKILIIEDDRDQALLTRNSIEDAFDEAEVTISSTGEEALGKDVSLYDVSIMDYNLPDMTGLDILRQLHDREHGPIIMLTGEEILEIAVQSLKEGADEFIVKSIDIYQLLPHIIERTVENYNWRKNMEAMENREREKKVQIETLKRIMRTLAHHLNNGVMPIIFSAELCQRSDYNLEKVKKLVETSLRETHRINFIIERFERYIEDEEFKYMDYLDLKDAMFDV